MFTLLHSILLSTTTERNFCSFEELIKRNKGFLVATCKLKKKYCSCTHLYNNARERTRLSLVKVPIFPWQFPSYGNYCSLRVKAVKKELHFALWARVSTKNLPHYCNEHLEIRTSTFCKKVFQEFGRNFSQTLKLTNFTPRTLQYLTFLARKLKYFRFGIFLIICAKIQSFQFVVFINFGAKIQSLLL